LGYCCCSLSLSPASLTNPSPKFRSPMRNQTKNNTSKLRNMNARQPRHSIWLGGVQDLPRRHAVERFLQESRGITTLRHLNRQDFQWRIRCSCVSTPVVDLRGFLLKLCQLQRFQRISVPDHIGVRDKPYRPLLRPLEVAAGWWHRSRRRVSMPRRAF
jgi:hypothetical protein